MKEEDMNLKANFGCGYEILIGYINYDIYTYINNNLVEYIDLERLPLDFEDETFDEIMMDNVMEHLFINRFNFMLEISRILTIGGIFKCLLPMFSPRLQHISWLHLKNYFGSLLTEGGHGQQKKLFEQIEFKRHWNGNNIFGFTNEYWLKKI